MIDTLCSHLLIYLERPKVWSSGSFASDLISKTGCPYDLVSDITLSESVIIVDSDINYDLNRLKLILENISEYKIPTLILFRNEFIKDLKDFDIDEFNFMYDIGNDCVLSKNLSESFYRQSYVLENGKISNLEFNPFEFGNSVQVLSLKEFYSYLIYNRLNNLSDYVYIDDYTDSIGHLYLSDISRIYGKTVVSSKNKQDYLLSPYYNFQQVKNPPKINEDRHWKVYINNNDDIDEATYLISLLNKIDNINVLSNDSRLTHTYLNLNSIDEFLSVDTAIFLGESNPLHIFYALSAGCKIISPFQYEENSWQIPEEDERELIFFLHEILNKPVKSRLTVLNKLSIKNRCSEISKKISSYFDLFQEEPYNILEYFNREVYESKVSPTIDVFYLIEDTSEIDSIPIEYKNLGSIRFIISDKVDPFHLSLYFHEPNIVSDRLHKLSVEELMEIICKNGSSEYISIMSKNFLLDPLYVNSFNNWFLGLRGSVDWLVADVQSNAVISCPVCFNRSSLIVNKSTDILIPKFMSKSTLPSSHILSKKTYWKGNTSNHVVSEKSWNIYVKQGEISGDINIKNIKGKIKDFISDGDVNVYTDSSLNESIIDFLSDYNIKVILHLSDVDLKDDVIFHIFSSNLNAVILDVNKIREADLREFIAKVKKYQYSNAILSPYMRLGFSGLNNSQDAQTLIDKSLKYYLNVHEGSSGDVLDKFKGILESQGLFIVR